MRKTASSLILALVPARPRIGVVLATLGIATAIGVGPAAAQSNNVEALVQSIRQLETQLRVLQREVYRDGAPRDAGRLDETPAPLRGGSTSATTQLQVRLDQFEQEVRTLTGQVEEFSFALRQVGSRMDKLVSDMDFRLRSLEGGAPVNVANSGPAGQATQSRQTLSPGPAPGSQAVTIAPPRSATPGVLGQLTDSQLRQAGVATQPPAAPLTTEVARAAPAAAADVALPAGPPQAQYDFARNLLMQRDFTRAETALRAFISSNPNDTLAGNAQYWLGETYYVRQNYLDAARTFAEGYQQYPESSKAADNLLKLGLSLVNLDRKNDACITLTRLTSEYTNAAANILQRAQREQQRLGCG